MVIGSGPGGAVTACLLREAGRDVLLLEEGPDLAVGSAEHFSPQEMRQKYRNGGVAVAMGRVKVAFAEARCVGGGSEINRGLYHRLPDEVASHWRRGFGLDAFKADDLGPHFAACEQVARVSYLPGPAPAISQKLADGARALGWQCVEAPRLVDYALDPGAAPTGRKQSMSETFMPRFRRAGGRILADTRVRRLKRTNRRWEIKAQRLVGGRPSELTIHARHVIVACGATQTPALLRRSGIVRKVGDTLRFHPMLKVVARFPEPVNEEDALEPVHQVKQFDPAFSMGCSISKRPALALALAGQPERLREIDRDWRHLAIYYAQSTGGRGTVRNLPGFADPLVRVALSDRDAGDLTAGLKRLAECLFAAGAEKVMTRVPGHEVIRSEEEVARLPERLPLERVGLSALHLFSSCPMAADERHGATDAFGRVHGADGLRVADCSLLCGPTVVNPQGTVMAIAHRNAHHFLDDRRR